MRSTASRRRWLLAWRSTIPGRRAQGEALLEILASPINPSDLLRIRGAYGTSPGSLPALAGSQGLGRVVEVGEGVTNVAAGDLVPVHVFLTGGSVWAERLKCPAEALVALPDADPLQLSMLPVNPPTAALMLSDYATLAPGDWVIQNAANSTVGLYLVQLAASQGLNTVNVVRREGAAEPVRAAGAEHVLVSGPDLAERVAEVTGGNLPKLAIDAVAGEDTDRLAASTAEGGTVVNYGLLSGQACQIHPRHIVFRRITLTGFWMQDYFQRAPRAQLHALYTNLGHLIAEGRLSVPVAATYGLDDIQAALAHAAAGEREGKVFVTPNP